MRLHTLPTFSSLALALVLLTPQVLLAQYDTSTVAGGGPNNLAALKASIGYPGSIAFDTAGNTYVTDFYSSDVLKVDTSGNVTVVAGNGTFGYSGDGGPATSAALDGPVGVFVDGSGNIYIADTGNDLIRVVNTGTAQITIAGIAIPPGDIQTVAGTYYQANGENGCVYSGDGKPATSANLCNPYGVAVDAAGDIFIADTFNEAIREVSASSGNINTVAGNGTFCADPTTPCGDGGAATSAQLDLPEGVFVDTSGNIFIADTDTNRIRVVNTGTAQITIAGVAIPAGAIQTVAGAYYQSSGGTACEYSGNPGPATSAQLCVPANVFVDSSENIFIADAGNSVIWEVTASTSAIATVAGDNTLGAGYSGDGGPATSAQLDSPNDIFVDGAGDIFIADTDNFATREVTTSNGYIQTIIGNGFLAYSGDGGTAVNAELNYPGALFVDASDDIFIADTVSSVIREVAAASGDIQTVAGNGTPCPAPPTSVCGDGGLAAGAQLNNPNGLFRDASGNIFIADTSDNRIRVVNAGAAAITLAGVTIQPGDIATVAGSGTQGYAGDGAAATSAELDGPGGVFVDSAENIFIADTSNHVIRAVNTGTQAVTLAGVSIPPGDIATVAGTGTVMCSDGTALCGDGGPATSAQLADPRGVFVDSSENIYVADTGDNRIRVVNTSTGAVTVAGISIPAGDIATVAGTGTEGYQPVAGVPATGAQLSGPSGVFVDPSGDIFIADTANFVIREVVGATGFIATVAGNNAQGFSGDGGPSTSAQLNSAYGLFGDAAGNLFVADTDNSRIRKMLLTITAPTATVPAAQTTSAGGTATYPIKLNANTGNPKYAITLSCLQSSLPPSATCSFSPAAITPAPYPVAFTLTITVPSGSASLEKPNSMRLPLFFALACVPLAGILFAGIERRNKWSRWLLLAGLCAFLILLNACGGSSGSGSKGTTYNVEVQGTTTAQPNPVTITTASLTVQ